MTDLTPGEFSLSEIQILCADAWRTATEVWPWRERSNRLAGDLKDLGTLVYEIKCDPRREDIELLVEIPCIFFKSLMSDRRLISGHRRRLARTNLCAIAQEMTTEIIADVAPELLTLCRSRWVQSVLDDEEERDPRRMAKRDLRDLLRAGLVADVDALLADVSDVRRRAFVWSREATSARVREGVVGDPGRGARDAQPGTARHVRDLVPRTVRKEAAETGRTYDAAGVAPGVDCCSLDRMLEDISDHLISNRRDIVSLQPGIGLVSPIGPLLRVVASFCDQGLVNLDGTRISADQLSRAVEYIGENEPYALWSLTCPDRDLGPLRRLLSALLSGVFI